MSRGKIRFPGTSRGKENAQKSRQKADELIRITLFYTYDASTLLHNNAQKYAAFQFFLGGASDRYNRATMSDENEYNTKEINKTRTRTAAR